MKNRTRADTEKIKEVQGLLKAALDDKEDAWVFHDYYFLSFENCFLTFSEFLLVFAEFMLKPIRIQ